MKANLLVLGGALAGGVLGYFAFFWVADQGFYGLILPGALMGLGAGLAKHRSVPLAIACGLSAVALGLFTEWRFAPFRKDDSLAYFLLHAWELKPITLLMIAVGGAIAFWVPYRRLEAGPPRAAKGPSLFVYALINARIMPLDRGERYEDPLIAALAKNGYGEVTGGGTMQQETGELEYCGVDVDLFDVEQGIPFLCDFLAKRGAPKGSKLQYEQHGRKVEVPFGDAEGLALYLNGTDLPDEVYERCSLDDVIAEINKRLGNRGGIQGQWQGPSETALYMYGNSADEMRRLIASYVAEYPLCQKSRLVTLTP